MLVGFGKPLLHTAALREKFVQDVVEAVDGVVEHEGQPVEGGRGLSRVIEQAQVFAGKDDAGDDAFQLDMQDLETFGRERYGGGAAVHDATSTVREVPYIVQRTRVDRGSRSRASASRAEASPKRASLWARCSRGRKPPHNAAERERRME